MFNEKNQYICLLEETGFGLIKEDDLLLKVEQQLFQLYFIVFKNSKKFHKNSNNSFVISRFLGKIMLWKS